MNLSLKGRHAVVCGGSKGIGQAAAHAMALLGAHITLISRSEPDLQSAVTLLPQPDGQAHHYHAVDMSDEKALRQVADELHVSDVHILINNTGGPPAGRLEDAGTEDLMWAFRLHILSAQILSSAVIPSMTASGYGRIINVISTSVKEPIPGLGVSNTIRGAMGNWAKTMAAELGPHGITVNNVLPGFTATDRLESIIQRKMAAQDKSYDEVTTTMKSHVPLRRFADPSEVGEVIAFLASPAASYVSGINVPVDGGRTKSL